MDYTSVELVKEALHSVSEVDDTLLARVVTAASRAIDRKCTGTPEALDYFKLEPVTDEIIQARVSTAKYLICYPHKPIVRSVEAFAFRFFPFEPWIEVSPTRLWAAGGTRVEAYPESIDTPHNSCQVKISYTGGLGETLEDLPADLVECATILAVRYYREAETGLTDAIGVAELGTMIYTKAWPVRVKEQIQPFIRLIGWRHAG